MTANWSLTFDEMAAELLKTNAPEQSRTEQGAVIREVTLDPGKPGDIAFSVRFTNTRTHADVTEHFDSLADLSRILSAADGIDVAQALIVEFDEQVFASPGGNS